MENRATLKLTVYEFSIKDYVVNYLHVRIIHGLRWKYIIV